MFRTFCLSLAVLASALAGLSAAEQPTVSMTYLGSVTGTVVKVESGSITVKVPTPVRSGVTRRRMGNRTVSVPRYTTKQVENTQPLSADVVVKTVGGKSATLEDVRPGVAVRLHVYSVKERTVGEKPVARSEVRRIDIPNSAASK
jgi:hypothetical protein